MQDATVTRRCPWFLLEHIWPNVSPINDGKCGCIHIYIYIHITYKVMFKRTPKGHNFFHAFGRAAKNLDAAKVPGGNGSARSPLWRMTLSMWALCCTTSSSAKKKSKTRIDQVSGQGLSLCSACKKSAQTKHPQSSTSTGTSPCPSALRVRIQKAGGLGGRLPPPCSKPPHHEVDARQTSTRQHLERRIILPKAFS